ncbi:ComF family protein [Vibrio inusitatus]|uniref:ComF family protein n=1 Tax=Vibrio inusitatus TaxID=413402 RepID=UPI001FCBF635|nr:ComF family protein [Vibrio inusitatus]
MNPIWCPECIDLLKPVCRCATCGTMMEMPVERCGGCVSNPPLWDGLYCIGEYNEPLSWYVQGLKYRRQVWHARELASLLAERLESPAPLLLPIPLHWRRQCARGFNQSDYLANYLSQSLKERTGVESQVLSKAIRRVKVTKTQMGLNRRQRLVNLKHAFSLSPDYLASIQNHSHIALVDDVVTTGSTVAEVCLLLKNQGVKRIDVYCICRASKPIL